jgi:hypothetical protein
MKKRTIAFSLTCIAVLATTLLAPGLSGLEFSPGQPFSLFNENQPAGIEKLTFREWNLVGLWKILGAVFLWVLVPAALIYFIVSPEARRKAIRRALTTSLTLYGFFLLLRQCGRLNPEGLFDFQPLSEINDSTNQAVEAIFRHDSPDWLVFLLNFLVTSIFIGVIAYLILRMRSTASTLDKLSIEAHEALSDLKTGADLKNTILRCYVDMNHVINDKRGIRRHSATTPREFERRLMTTGLPEAQIQRLTRLFEHVRYGDQDFDNVVEKEAIECLTAIIAACETN